MSKKLLFTLAGLGLLLQSGLTAARAQEAAPKPLTHVLVTQITSGNGERSYSIQSVELATGTATNITKASPRKENLLLGASPSRARFAISNEDADGKAQLQTLDRSGKVERSLATDDQIFTLTFESDESLLFVERIRNKTEDGSDPEQGHRLRRWNLKDGSTEVLRTVEASYWDDVPLNVGPKGRWATWYSREGGEGLVLFDLKTKAATQPFPKGATILALNPDGKGVSLFDKKRGTGVEGELDEKGIFKEIKVSEDGGFDYQYSDGFAARLKLQLKEGRRGAILELRELATKKTWTLTEQVVLSDGVTRLFDIDLASKTVIFNEGPNKREMKLITAKLGEKGLEDRKVILEGGYIHIPFFAR